MPTPAIAFDAVWKRFRRGERYDSLRDLAPSLFRQLFRGAAENDLRDSRDFWALQDVSFEVHPGEALGIIGPNGAGKSTILKLLTKILRPTRGRSAVRGRIGALIEVAAGFHPDLTGRENICLQGAIMGMKRAEIARKLDEIIAFADVGEFVDTPVKRYSSGMNARLGFSIAAHLDPDVLVIDEVLSVGDMSFQQRGVERMEDFKRRGVAIVFVSHNMQAVSQLCERCLFLNKRTQALGRTSDVIAGYVEAAGRKGVSTDSAVSIVSVRSTDAAGQRLHTVQPGMPIFIRVVYEARQDLSGVELGVNVIRSTDGFDVYHANFSSRELGLGDLRRGDTFSVEFTFRVHLARGHYHVACHAFHGPTHQYLASLSPAVHFTVVESRTRAGVADLEARAVARRMTLEVPVTI
jgi:lipopolysaccharide transport system ATP-binding protein